MEGVLITITISKKFRVYKLDKYNYSYDIYRGVMPKDPRKPIYYKWVHVKKYYSRLKDCLLAVSDYIVNDLTGSGDYDPDQALKVLDELLTEIDSLEIQILKGEQPQND